MRARWTPASACSRSSVSTRPIHLATACAHVGNLLYPRHGVASGIRLIDWAGWRVGRGVADLAYMMAVHWFPERRARLEGGTRSRYPCSTAVMTYNGSCYTSHGFAAAVGAWGCVTSGPGATRRGRMARSNGLSRPRCSSGPTRASIAIPLSAGRPWRAGCTTTIGTGRILASVAAPDHPGHPCARSGETSGLGRDPPTSEPVGSSRTLRDLNARRRKRGERVGEYEGKCWVRCKEHDRHRSRRISCRRDVTRTHPEFAVMSALRVPNCRQCRVCLSSREMFMNAKHDDVGQRTRNNRYNNHRGCQ
jgi:hypothetical protein